MLLISACSPGLISNEQTASKSTEPMASVLKQSSFISFDGTSLPLRSWLPAEKQATAVMVAVHGFNDYSHFIDGAADYFAAQGIAVYAYDQRGFGAAPDHGLWPGKDVLVADLHAFVGLIRQRFPTKQVFLLGESMGAAVVLHALDRGDVAVDGVILSAPAVWGWDAMPFWQRWALKLAVRIMPAKQFTGESLGVIASDNRDMLIALSRDPLIIKATRVDSMYGLVNLMQAGYDAVDALQLPALIVYGEHDEIIPKQPVLETFGRLSKQSNQQRLYVYKHGYHMLLRDLQAKVVWQDILVWMHDHHAPLPSQQQGLSSAIQ
ncbi:MAG: lysophospholipase [Mariprofundus sp.]|nr:lysophospholipase [Mariprofundus sp.]